MWDSISYFFYFESKLDSLNKIKREIIRTISLQIRENRELTNFELKTVINSKLRENRKKEGSILIIDVIEDLVAEIIASPLIDSNRKKSILENLVNLHDENSSNIPLHNYHFKYKKTSISVYKNLFLIIAIMIAIILGIWVGSSFRIVENVFILEDLESNFWLNIIIGTISSSIALVVTILAKNIQAKWTKFNEGRN